MPLGDAMSETACPGCGLVMPENTTLSTHRYINASPECWNVYTEVLEAEYSNAVLFGKVHQITVDTYAVQHAGGQHPDKSIAVHLSGLLLVLDRGLRPTAVAPNLQRLATKVRTWPHFAQPSIVSSITVFDVAISESVEQHISTVRDWSDAVWKAWTPHHDAIAEFVDAHLTKATH